MSIHFKCDKCESGIKAPDNLAGRAAKCPKCKQHIVVPCIQIEQMPIRITGDSNGNSTNLNEAQNITKYKPKKQIKVCPFCKKEIPTAATMCKSCEIAFGCEIAEAKKQKERISIELHQEYRHLECLRENELRSTLLYGLSGPMLIVLGWWLIIPAPILSSLLWIVGGLFLIYGCMSYAIYKGRNITWGLILGFTVWPLIIFLHDVNKDKMNEIKARIETLHIPVA
jgi:hypothetical protein